MNKDFEKKFSLLIVELRTLRQTYPKSIEANKDAETDFEVGVSCLEDSLKALQKDAEEEWSEPSREEYKDALREEQATKGAD